MGALRDQTAVNIREWGDGRKQEPVRGLYLRLSVFGIYSVSWLGWSVLVA